MLQFNPHFRPTSRELLKHKLFAKIHQSDKKANHKIDIEIDRNIYALTYGGSRASMKKEEQLTQCQMNVVKEYVKFNSTNSKIKVSFTGISNKTSKKM